MAGRVAKFRRLFLGKQAKFYLQNFTNLLFLHRPANVGRAVAVTRKPQSAR